MTTKIFGENNWPTTAREFVLMVARQIIIKPADLCALIADAFGNPHRANT